MTASAATSSGDCAKFNRRRRNPFRSQQDEIGADDILREGSRVKAFAELYAALDATTKTNEKIEALTAYFLRVPPEDAAWAIHFLIGRRLKRLIESRKLWHWAIDEAGIPEWLFGECYEAVGDVAETIALLLPSPQASSARPLHYWV